MGRAASSTKILAGSLKDFIIGEGVCDVFVTGAAFFCADLPEPRALAALASITVILKQDGGVEGRRAGVLALDPVGAGAGAGAGAVVWDGAGGGLGSVPTRMDPNTVSAAKVGDGTGE